MPFRKRLLSITICALLLVDLSYTPHLQSSPIAIAIPAVVTQISTATITCIGFLAAKLSGVTKSDPLVIHHALDNSLNITRQTPTHATRTVGPIQELAQAPLTTQANHESVHTINPQAHPTKPLSTASPAPVEKIYATSAKAIPSATTQECTKAQAYVAKITLSNIAKSFTQSCVQSKSNYRQQIAEQYSHGAPTYQSFCTESQAILQGTENNWFIHYGLKQTPPASFAVESEECIQNLMAYHTIPEYRAHVQKCWFSDVNAFLAIDSPNPVARVEAALNLLSRDASDPMYADTFYETKKNLLKYLFDSDGRLSNTIVQRRTSDVSYFVKKFIDRSVTDYVQREQLKSQLPDCSDVQGTGLRWPVLGNLQYRALNHPMNTVYKNLITAGKCYEMQPVAQIKKQYPADQSVQTLARYYQVDYHTKAYNERGIVRVGLQDPFFLNTDKNRLKDIYANSTLREPFNQELLVRYGVKATLQERWAIPDYAPPYVHNALYKLLDNGGEPLSHITKLQETVETILANAPADKYPQLIQAFYEPNGVLKEIAHQVPQTKQLKIPSEILSPEHASTRNKLNTLLHTIHADPMATELAQKETQDLQQSFVKVTATPDLGVQNVVQEAARRNKDHVTTQNNALLKQLAIQAFKQKIAPVKQDAGNASQRTQQKPVIITDVKSSILMPQGPEWEPEKEKTKANTTFTDAEAPELSEGLAKRNAVYKTVQETGEKCRIVRPIKDVDCPQWADMKYQAIRSCTNDIKTIAKNTGFSEEKITKVKDHLFHKEHILEKGKMRFEPDHEIAAAWDRLYRGDFIKNDIQLLEHEYFESEFEALHKTDYDTAHTAAQHPIKGKPWFLQNFKD